MNISVQARALCNALILAGAIARVGKNKCLAHLIASEKIISIACTDTIGTIVANAAAAVHEGGEAAVAIDRLTALASSFAPGEIIQIETTATRVNIACGSSMSRLPAVPIEDLPETVALANLEATIEINYDDLLRLLEPLAAADTGRARLYLTGVLWHSAADRLAAVSTDGIKLICTSVVAPRFCNGLILPKDAGVVLRKLLQKAGRPHIRLHHSTSLIAFETTEFSFTARLIDGTFPSYQTIIPPVAPNSVTCDRGHLLVALSRLSAAAANIGIGLVGMRWGHGSGLDLFLARQPLDGADKIEAEVSGNAEVVLSLPQFASMLAEFCCERIRLETADGQPVVIRGEREKLGLIARCTWNFRRDEARDAELQRT